MAAILAFMGLQRELEEGGLDHDWKKGLQQSWGVIHEERAGIEADAGYRNRVMSQGGAEPDVLRFRVVDERGGEAVADALVSMEQGGVELCVGATDAYGVVHLQLERDSYHGRLSIAKRGYLTESVSARPGNGAAAEQLVRMRAGGDGRIIVQSAGDSPPGIEGEAKVALFIDWPEGTRSSGAVCEVGSHVDMEGVPYGRQLLLDVRTESGGTWRGNVVFTVRQPIVEVRLSQGYPLFGKCLRRSGEPVPGKRIRLVGTDTGASAGTTTRDDGGFSFFNLGVGEYRASCAGRDLAIVSVLPKLDNSTILVLDSPAAREGTIVSEGGRPMGGVQVSSYLGGINLLETVRTDLDGKFLLRDPGKHGAIVTVAGEFTDGVQELMMTWSDLEDGDWIVVQEVPEGGLHASQNCAQGKYEIARSMGCGDVWKMRVEPGATVTLEGGSYSIIEIGGTKGVVDDEVLVEPGIVSMFECSAREILSSGYQIRGQVEATGVSVPWVSVGLYRGARRVMGRHDRLQPPRYEALVEGLAVDGFFSLDLPMKELQEGPLFLSCSAPGAVCEAELRIDKVADAADFAYLRLTAQASLTVLGIERGREIPEVFEVGSESLIPGELISSGEARYEGLRPGKLHRVVGESWAGSVSIRSGANTWRLPARTGGLESKAVTLVGPDAERCHFALRLGLLGGQAFGVLGERVGGGRFLWDRDVYEGDVIVGIAATDGITSFFYVGGQPEDDMGQYARQATGVLRLHGAVAMFVEVAVLAVGDLPLDGLMSRAVPVFRGRIPAGEMRSVARLPECRLRVVSWLGDGGAHVEVIDFDGALGEHLVEH